MSQVNLDKVLESIDKALREKARRAVTALMVECLGNQDLMLLSGLGVDGPKKLLQIFVEEANKLLNEESKDAGTRS